MKEIETAAQRLREASKSIITCTPIRDLIGETDIASAYAVQEINTNLRLAEGASIIGEKIGPTNVAFQNHFGIDQPDCGMPWHDMESKNGNVLSDLTGALGPFIDIEVGDHFVENIQGLRQVSVTFS